MEKFYKIFQNNFFASKKTSIKVNGPLPVITISREMGSGGKSIANLVAFRLGQPWQVYDHEMIDVIAKDKNQEKILTDLVDPTKRPLADIIVSKIFGKRLSHLSGYQRHLVRVMSLVGLKGHTIILGRGGNFLFPNALKVRIICQMDQRIAWQMTYEKISRMQAIKRISESDVERKTFVQSLFNHNHSQAYHYDLVLKTGPNMTIEDAADIIIDVAKRKFKI